jgi:DNA-binding CsgD family transcriptional regulator
MHRLPQIDGPPLTTPTRDAIAAYIARGYRDAQIARKIGCSREYVRQIRRMISATVNGVGGRRG